MRSGFFVQLRHRGMVRISGPDRRAFLQGLITNDVGLLDAQSLIYSCLLTPQGKFMHDFFLSEQSDTLCLECEGSERATDLAATLTKFRLRSKINIEAIENIDVFMADIGVFHDPRHPALGFHHYTRPDLNEASFDEWDRHRIMLGIPDGSRDMDIGQSTLLECNLDKLNAMSLTKGCYMGQELTARMHYRNLGKKHPYPVQALNAPLPAPHTDLRTQDDTLIGEMRSGCGDVGLALLRDDALDQLEMVGLRLLDRKNPA